MVKQNGSNQCWPKKRFWLILSSSASHSEKYVKLDGIGYSSGIRFTNRPVPGLPSTSPLW